MHRAVALSLGLLLVPSCTGTIVRDANRLAQLPPLPYRVAVVGGAFLSPTDRAVVGRVPDDSRDGVEQLWSRTFRQGDAEPIDIETILSTLARGRAATLLWTADDFDTTDREELARGDKGALERARRAAEAADIDLLLTVEGLREGPVQYLGVTGQWPITTVAWLLAGLGLFVPDHRFESKAKMRASVRDVHSGRVLLSRMVFAPGTLDLSLLDRTDFLGIVSTIVVPPTLVGNDVEDVVAKVREDGAQRLVLGLLARLKDPETLDALRSAMPIHLEMRVEGSAAIVDLRSRQEVQDLLVQVFDSTGQRRVLDVAEFTRFRREMLASVRREQEDLVYRATFALRGGDASIRIVVQDVAAQRASSSVLRRR